MDCYIQQMDRCRHKLVPYIVSDRHTNFDKHTSLYQNPYIAKCNVFIVQLPGWYTITNLDSIIDITSKLTFTTKAFDTFS
jgi:hypothetical protein